MGLPSGNRWAVSNLDATGPYFFQASPFQYESSFFSWGNVTPHNPINESAFDYNFGGINSEAPWYEGQPYGDTPGSMLTGNIPLTNDAARRLIGSPWHMPSSNDFDELINNCDYIDANGTVVVTTNKIVTVNGVMGIYLQSKINGNRIFFACSGYGDHRQWRFSGQRGGYWTINYGGPYRAFLLNLTSGGVSPQIAFNRHDGRTIRAIWNPSDLHG